MSEILTEEEVDLLLDAVTEPNDPDVKERFQRALAAKKQGTSKENNYENG